MAEGIGCPGCFIAKAEAVGFFLGPSMGPLWAKFPTQFPEGSLEIPLNSWPIIGHRQRKLSFEVSRQFTIWPSPRVTGTGRQRNNLPSINVWIFVLALWKHFFRELVHCTSSTTYDIFSKMWYHMYHDMLDTMCLVFG